MRKLFIVGCPRSGTTMLQQALNRHSAVAIPPETSFFSNVVGRSHRRQHAQLLRINADLQIDLQVPPVPIHDDRQARTLYERMAGLYLEQIKEKDVEYFGEKTPRHLLHLDKIRALFPDAKIILIFRDGRAVTLSLTKTPWGCPDPYFNFVMWLRYVRTQRRLERECPLDLLCVRYEDLVAEPEAQLRKVTDFLGLTFEPTMVESGGAKHGVPEWEREWKARAAEPINASRVDVWRRELPERVIAHMERLGGDALRALGYELVTNGRRRLPWTFFPHLWWTQFAWRLRWFIGLPPRASGARRS